MNIMYERKFDLESVYEWMACLDVELYQYIRDAEIFGQSASAEILNDIQNMLDNVRGELFSILYENDDEK